MIRVTKSARRSEFLYQSVLWLVLLVVCITTLYPFVNILAKSFSSGEAMIGKRIHILPIEPTLINYHVIFIDSTLKNALLISTTRTLIGTSLHLLVICLAAYAVSKRHLRGRKFFILYFIIPMYFNGGLLPSYMLIRTLGLMNNLLVYILPGLFNAFHLLILTTYFKHLPQDYEEAAKIDGASDLTVFFRIVLPLSAPIIATVALFSAVGHWNSWFDALLYVTRSRLLPLQMVLQMIIRGAQTVQLMTRAQYGMAEAKSANFTVESVRAATICFAVIPILCVYPFLQQYFVKGIMIGGLKG